MFTYVYIVYLLFKFFPWSRERERAKANKGNVKKFLHCKF